MEAIFPALYILAAACFILAIKWMNSPLTARRGVLVGEIGMLMAVVGTLLRHEVVNYQWILIAFFVGSAIGVPLAYLMPMTAVPQRTAFSHACGALASALIGTAEYFRHTPHGFVMTALVIETLLGFLTFTASLMAFGKLQEILPTRPITYRGQNFVNLAVFALAVAERTGRSAIFFVLVWIVPNAPKSTFEKERFMARHMMTERMKPEEPSRAPATIRSLLSRTNPMALAERPA